MSLAVGATVASSCALAAAASFGTGVALQHRQVQAVATSAGGVQHLLTALLQRRLWLAGVALTVLAYGLQGLALSFGPLTLVAPIVALDLVFAIPISVRWSGRRMGTADWLGCACAAGGVAAFVAASPPSPGSSVATVWQWGFAVGAVALVTTCVVAAAERAGGRARAALLGVAAGVVFGLTAAVTLSLTRELRYRGLDLLFVTWQTWALVGLGLTGFVISAIAYGAGELSTTLPIMDTVEPLTGVLLGVLVFGERLARFPTGLLVQAAGGVFAVIGIVMLSRSPLVTSVDQPALR